MIYDFGQLFIYVSNKKSRMLVWHLEIYNTKLLYTIY